MTRSDDTRFAPALEIRQESIQLVPEIARVSIAFRVERRLVVDAVGPARFEWSEVLVPVPWIKDYDAIPSNHPSDWPNQFDLANWCLLSARLDGRWIGSALIAWRGHDVDLLEGRDDMALLWDLRVEPAMRSRGVGASLFRAAEAWARGQGCRELRIETQDVNAAACRFYAAQGAAIHTLRPLAYAELPDETQILWSKQLR